MIPWQMRYYKTRSWLIKVTKTLQEVRIVSHQRTICQLKKWPRSFLLWRRSRYRSLRKQWRKGRTMRQWQQLSHNQSQWSRRRKNQYLLRRYSQGWSHPQKYQLKSPRKRKRKKQRRSQSWGMHALRQKGVIYSESKSSNKHSNRPNCFSKWSMQVLYKTHISLRIIWQTKRF